MFVGTYSQKYQKVHSIQLVSPHACLPHPAFINQLRKAPQIHLIDEKTITSTKSSKLPVEVTL
jgi:hypothetical protein